jgi:hypothetical protein
MQNAHLRMGKLTFTRQTKDHSTNISLHLDRLVAEPVTERAGSAALHLVSVFGGDQEIGAIVAAISDDQYLHVYANGSEFAGTMGEKPVLYRASLQTPGRKRPVRHIVAVSQTLFKTTLGADGEARRTILYDDTPSFMLYRLAVRFGLPVLPEWAEWFHGELRRREMVEDLVGLNCSPVAVKGSKIRMLRILSQGLRRHQINLPRETGVGESPAASLL